MKMRRLLLVAIGTGIATWAVVSAQAPDCTGISTAFNTNPDLVGELTTVRVASGLSRPVFVTAPPDDVERVFIVEQDGLIRVLENGTLLATAFLDVRALTRSPLDGCGTNCEQGLLGLAFDPGYAANRYFFIYHTDAAGTNEVLARYQRDPSNPNLALAATRTVVLTLPTIAANHNGGTIAFSPNDADLYLGTGDGGNSCDFLDQAQDLTSRLGKMLRMDVSSLPYSTAGNPFDGSMDNAKEIWSWGLRNPYRWSFDRSTGALYIGDVGQSIWEEIDCEPAGTGSKNYGWDFYEGDHCPNQSCGGSALNCDPPNYTPPIVEYDQAGTPCSVIGGYVYRGCRMPDLHGSYFYADYCASNVESFRTDATCSVSNAITRTADLNDAGQSIGSISGFGEDARGEIYIVDRGSTSADGELFKLLPALSIVEVSSANAAPLLLGKTDWFWEDMVAMSGYPVGGYRVYRSLNAAGPFRCKKTLSGNTWAGGDPQVPASGSVFYYVVTASNAGEESLLGFRSDGTPRPTAPAICL